MGRKNDTQDLNDLDNGPLYHLIEGIDPLKTERPYGGPPTTYPTKSVSLRGGGRSSREYVDTRQLPEQVGNEIIRRLDEKDIDPEEVISLCDGMDRGRVNRFSKEYNVNPGSISTVLGKLRKGEIPGGLVAAAALHLLILERLRQRQEEAAKRKRK